MACACCLGCNTTCRELCSLTVIPAFISALLSTCYLSLSVIPSLNHVAALTLSSTKWSTGRPHATLLWGRRIIEVIIDHTHQTIGHFGQSKTSKYTQCFYWWPVMATNINAFCETCTVCQMSKTDNRRPAGLLHTLPIPNRPWESIGMDLMGPLPMSKDY